MEPQQASPTQQTGKTSVNPIHLTGPHVSRELLLLQSIKHFLDLPLKSASGGLSRVSFGTVHDEYTLQRSEDCENLAVTHKMQLDRVLLPGFSETGKMNIHSNGMWIRSGLGNGFKMFFLSRRIFWFHRCLPSNLDDGCPDMSMNRPEIFDLLVIAIGYFHFVHVVSRSISTSTSNRAVLENLCTNTLPNKEFIT